MKSLKSIQSIYDTLLMNMQYYDLIIYGLSKQNNRTELEKALKLRKKLKKNIHKIEKYAKKEQKKVKRLIKEHIINGVNQKESLEENAKENITKETINKNDITKSKSTNKKRIRLGSNISYSDSIEFCNCTLNSDINLLNEQVKFPYKTDVLINDTLIGCIEVISPKIFKIAKGTKVLNDIKENSLSRISELKNTMYTENTLIKKNNTYSITKKDVELTSLLDAVTFLCGQKKTAFNGIELKLKDETGDEKQ